MTRPANRVTGAATRRTASAATRRTASAATRRTASAVIATATILATSITSSCGGTSDETTVSEPPAGQVATTVRVASDPSDGQLSRAHRVVTALYAQALRREGAEIEWVEASPHPDGPLDAIAGGDATFTVVLSGADEPDPLAARPRDTVIALERANVQAATADGPHAVLVTPVASDTLLDKFGEQVETVTTRISLDADLGAVLQLDGVDGDNADSVLDAYLLDAGLSD